MKKTLAIAAALALALVGCGQSQPAQQTEKPAEEVVDDSKGATVDTESDIKWTEVKTAEEAAKGAGFEKFGVVDSFKLGDLEFKDPKFSYAGGVAQATYETPATMVYVRKGVNDYTAPLSDRKLDEFAAHWHKVYEGTDVTCYGAAKGAVTVAGWAEGDSSFAITFQGLGGEEMSMDSDELASLVKGFKEANADQKADDEEAKKKEEEEKKKKEEEAKKAEEAKKTEEANKNALLSQTDAEAKVEKDCGGDCRSIDRVSTKQYGECWYAVCVDGNGVTYEYYVNNDGVYLIHKSEAKKQEQKKQESTGEHYEGEPVTILGSIYAEWHQMNDGSWYATFVTYNGTQIFAQPAPAGSGWAFTAFADGTTYTVYYSEESSDMGQTGPAGVSSHWSDNNGRWF